MRIDIPMPAAEPGTAAMTGFGMSQLRPEPVDIHTAFRVDVTVDARLQVGAGRKTATLPGKYDDSNRLIAVRLCEAHAADPREARS